MSSRKDNIWKGFECLNCIEGEHLLLEDGFITSAFENLEKILVIVEFI